MPQCPKTCPKVQSNVARLGRGADPAVATDHVDRIGPNEKSGRTPIGKSGKTENRKPRTGPGAEQEQPVYSTSDSSSDRNLEGSPAGEYDQDHRRGPGRSPGGTSHASGWRSQGAATETPAGGPGGRPGRSPGGTSHASGWRSQGGPTGTPEGVPGERPRRSPSGKSGGRTPGGTSAGRTGPASSGRGHDWSPTAGPSGTPGRSPAGGRVGYIRKESPDEDGEMSSTFGRFKGSGRSRYNDEAWNPNDHSPCPRECPYEKLKESLRRKAEEKQAAIDNYMLNKGWNYFEDMCTCSLICLGRQIVNDDFCRKTFASAVLFILGIKVCREMDAWYIPFHS